MGVLAECLVVVSTSKIHRFVHHLVDAVHSQICYIVHMQGRATPVERRFGSDRGVEQAGETRTQLDSVLWALGLAGLALTALSVRAGMP
jgi:hypothetical protein